MTAGTARRRDRSRPDGFNRALIAPMILGSILNPVNSSMLAVALVPIGTTFGAPPAQTAWLVTGLYLATAVGQPVVGRLVDMYGPRRLYLAGTALVGVAGLLGALAPSLAVLVAARVLLGFGTCAAYPASMHLIRSESERTGTASPSAVLAALSVANQTIIVIGPTLGGLLIGFGGWHTIFTVNVPLAAACLVLGTRRLPRGPAGTTHAPRRGIDAAGMVLFAALLVATMVFLMRPTPAHWYLPVLAAALGVAFTLRERRVAYPFIDLRVLAGNAPILATYARQLLTAVTSYAFLYGFTQWLEEGRGLAASAAGLVMLPMSAIAIVVTSVTGRRSQVYGKLVVGSLAQIAACAALLLTRSASPIWLLVGITVLVGVPQGLNGLANQNALYHQADPARIASSAGLLRTCGYLGALIASAATAAFFARHADTSGLHHLSLFLLVVGVLLLAATLLDRSLRRVGTSGAAPPARRHEPADATATG
ncbi:MAG TPA: MFS transporter [Micromonosporaceae bacterium]